MPTQAKSIKEFCADKSISVATFYRNQERMPRVVKIGHQSRILEEDEAAWKKRIQEEADSSGIQGAA